MNDHSNSNRWKLHVACYMSRLFEDLCNANGRGLTILEYGKYIVLGFILVFAIVPIQILALWAMLLNCSTGGLKEIRYGWSSSSGWPKTIQLLCVLTDKQHGIWQWKPLQEQLMQVGYCVAWWFAMPWERQLTTKSWYGWSYWDKPWCVSPPDRFWPPQPRLVPYGVSHEVSYSNLGWKGSVSLTKDGRRDHNIVCAIRATPRH